MFNYLVKSQFFHRCRIYLFIFLKSTTEGPEDHLYCRRYAKIHKDTPYINVVTEKNKQQR